MDENNINNSQENTQQYDDMPKYMQFRQNSPYAAQQPMEGQQAQEPYAVQQPTEGQQPMEGQQNSPYAAQQPTEGQQNSPYAAQQPAEGQQEPAIELDKQFIQENGGGDWTGRPEDPNKPMTYVYGQTSSGVGIREEVNQTYVNPYVKPDPRFQQNAPQFANTENPYGAKPYDTPYVMMPVGQNIPPINVKEKHTGRKILIGVLIFLGVIGLGIGAAFIFAKDYTENLLAKWTKSDAEYLAWVEEKNYEPLPEGPVAETKKVSVEDLKKELGNLKQQFTDGKGVSADIKVSIGENLADTINIPEIKGAEARFRFGAKDDAFGIALEPVYNGVSLLPIDASADREAGKIYLRLRSYTDDAFDISGIIGEEEVNRFFTEIDEFMAEMDTSLDAFISSSELESILSADIPEIKGEFVNRIVEEYFFETIRNLDSEMVNMEDSNLKVGDNEESCSKITVTFSSEDLKRIGLEILNKIKNDDEIYELAKSFAGGTFTKETYQSKLGELIRELENEKIEAGADWIVDVYTDSHGKILGRGLSADIKEIGKLAIVYGSFGEDGVTDDEISVKVAGMSVAEISIEGTDENGTKKGSVSFTVPIASMLTGGREGEKPAFIIDYEVSEATEKHSSGSITLRTEGIGSIPGLEGISLSDYALSAGYDSTIDGTNESCNINIELLRKQKSEARIDFSVETSDNPDVMLGERFGDKCLDINDMNTLMEVLDEEKLLGFIKEFEEKLENSGLNDVIRFFDPEYTGNITDEIDLNLMSVGKKKYVWELDELDNNTVYSYSYADFADRVILPNYGDKALRAEDIEVTQADYDEVLKRYIGDGSWEWVDADIIEEGDIVDIAFVPSYLGFSINDYAYDHFELTVGEDEITDGFDANLIGKKAGDRFTVTATTNAQYGDYAGYKVDFDTTVNSVKRYQYVVPEITQELAESHGFDSPEHFMDSIREIAFEEKLLECRTAYYEDTIGYILDNLRLLDGEDAIVAEMAEYSFDYYNQYSRHQGMTLEEYTGFGEEDCKAYLNSRLKDTVKLQLLYAGIIKNEHITVTGSEVRDYMKTLETTYHIESDEKLLNEVSIPQIIDMVYAEKINNVIYSEGGY